MGHVGTGMAAVSRQQQVLGWLTLPSMAATVGMLVLSAWFLLDARKDAWQQAEQSADNLSLALERDIAHTISAYDLSLQQAMSSFYQPGVENLSTPFRHKVVFDHSATADYFGPMLILSANGDVLLDSTSIQPPTLNLADRDYFTVHRDSRQAGLFISPVYRVVRHTNGLTMTISRRIDGLDGAFAGVAVGSLRLSYFQTLFARLQLGANGSVSLFLDDGHLIAHAPTRATDFGRNLANSAGFKQLMGRSGHAVSKASDGVSKMYSYRRIDELPLVISIAMPVDDIYAEWWRKTVPIGGIVAVLSCVTLALCGLFRLKMARRIRAEADLLARAQALEVMAATDGLTGVANRRALEEEMSRTWRNAIRQQEPVSMLMIDADCFKQFNDRYGHPAGDRVLRSIAACLEQTIHRPRDIAARYGGEEFVVLLPDTEEAGAADVAERVRRAVAALDIPHADGPSGCVTVSIGVASAWPVLDDREALLLKEADQALYQAKHGGRNRVCCAACDAPLPVVPVPALAADPA